jgi:Protein of unknown function (DUF3592)
MIKSTTAFAVAGCFAFFGSALLIRRKSRMKSWRRTQATIVRLKSDFESGTAPVLKFVPLGGSEEITFESRLFVTGVRHEIGKQVEVIYDPQNPSEASIASLGELNFPAIWCFCVAAMWAFGAFFVRASE